MNKIFKPLLLLAVVASAFVFTACSDDDDSNGGPTGPTQSIVQIATSTGDFSILVEALTATDLVGVLSGSGPFTVFAPDNDAFNAFFDDQQVTDANGDGSRVDDAAAALGVEAVRQTLLYHVLGAQVLAAQVPTKGYVSTASTAGPGGRQLSMLVESRSSGVFLNNGPTVTTANILATNGVIHRINAVITLPTIVDHAVNNADFSQLVGALTATNLVPALLLPGPFTVFAPTNQAFDIATAVAGLSTEQLSSVLTYHVAPGNLQSTDLFAGTFPTVNGQQISVAVGTGVTITDANGGVSNVIATDVQGTNGVIHVLDRVLIPNL
jgi:transforming growth factor-beta-induced protein